MIETQVISYILTSRNAAFVIANNLNADYFYNYSAEFTYIKNHIERYGKVPDEASFKGMFRDFVIEEVEESEQYLLDSLLTMYRRRKMIETFQEVKKLDGEGNFKDAYNLFLNTAESLSSELAIGCTDLFKDLSRFDSFVDRTQRPADYYLTTGFSELDAVMGGIDRKEELGVIMARTNMGKSYICLKMAVAAALHGLNVGFYSGEMTNLKVGFRMDSILGGLNGGSLMHGNVSIMDKYREYIDEVRKKYPKASLNVFTPADVNGPIGVNTMRAYIEKYKFDILFIDQLSLMDDDRHGRTREERQSNIIVDLKRLQTQKQMPIIAVVQQNREKNDDGSIDTTQIAGSDDIGKYATFVLAISRDKVDKDMMTIEVTKCRDGKAGSKVKYQTDLSIGKFTYIPEGGAPAQTLHSSQPAPEPEPAQVEEPAPVPEVDEDPWNGDVSF